MKTEFENDIQKVIYSPKKIAALVERLGKEISRDYAGKNPLLVSIMKGSTLFTADLMRSLTINCELDFMVVSSYAGTQSTGEINIILDLRTNIEGRDVIIVEDIIDSGLTLSCLKKLLEERSPNSVKICTLLDKPTGRKVELVGDYIGGTVGNEFIVGYGLDYDEKYRNLSYIGVLKESVYSHK